jgi:formate hydrogenlyase subunit 3/multisubunit Na+/H+ antiporter MnhD subunit
LSELTILKGAIDAGRPVVAAVYLTMLAMVFIGMATIVLRMVYGQPAGADGDSAAIAASREPLWSVVPSVTFGLAVLVLGVYVPPQLLDLLHKAVAALGANG